MSAVEDARAVLDQLPELRDAHTPDHVIDELANALASLLGHVERKSVRALIFQLRQAADALEWTLEEEDDAERGG